jgi:hypothetical protein
MEKLLSELHKLTDEEKLELITECIKENKEILGVIIITKGELIEELFRLNISEEIENWLNNSSSETIFEIVKKHCNEDLLCDYGNWDMSNEGLLSYLCFEEDEFIEEVERTIIIEKRDDIIDSIINQNK